jgi:Domain of unknown function (DUF5753)
MTSRATKCGSRALASTRTSLAQHAAGRISRAAPGSPWMIPAGHHNVTRSPNAGVASTYLERAEDLKRYHDIFGKLQSIALSPKDAIELIAETGRKYKDS